MLKIMQITDSKQKNMSMDVKKGLQRIEEPMRVIQTNMKIWKDAGWSLQQRTLTKSSVRSNSSDGVKELLKTKNKLPLVKANR